MAYQRFRLSAVWIIIGINLLVFIPTLINRELIFYFLGFQPAGFLSRPWTILTNLFVHSGFWHILANMITLYFFGSFLYRLIGRNKFLLIYFAGGILGNIVFFLLPPSPLATAVGASGAIFALAGVLVVLMPKLRVLLYFIVPLPLWVVVLVFMVIWTFLFGFAFETNIAWQAHLGGLVLGLVAGYFFRRRIRYFYT
jgi:membrane associated rhomboid family serine protease